MPSSLQASGGGSPSSSGLGTPVRRKSPCRWEAAGGQDDTDRGSASHGEEECEPLEGTRAKRMASPRDYDIPKEGMDWALALTMWAAFMSSSIYACSAWSEDLRRTLGVSATKMSALPSAGLMALTLSIIPGFMYDWRGPRICAQYSCLLHASGHTIMLLTFTFFAGYASALPILCIAFFLIGQGSCALFDSSLFVGASTGTDANRGKRVGAVSFCFGAGSAFWSLFYEYLKSFQPYFCVTGIIFTSTAAYIAWKVPSLVEKFKKQQEVSSPISAHWSVLLRSRSYYAYGAIFCVAQSISVACFISSVGLLGGSMGVKNPALLPVYFAVSDAPARLTMGYVRDWKGDATAQVISLFLVLFALALWRLVESAEILPIVLIVGGLGYGGNWSCVVPYISTLDGGASNIGIGFGIYATSVALGNPIASYFIAQVYDANAQEASILNGGSGSASDRCEGPQCFQTSANVFLVILFMAFGSLLGIHGLARRGGNAKPSPHSMKGEEMYEIIGSRDVADVDQEDAYENELPSIELFAPNT